jgi:hypothetical protein
MLLAIIITHNQINRIFILYGDEKNVPREYAIFFLLFHRVPLCSHSSCTARSPLVVVVVAALSCCSPLFPISSKHFPAFVSYYLDKSSHHHFIIIISPPPPKEKRRKKSQHNCSREPFLSALCIPRAHTHTHTLFHASRLLAAFFAT